ncbi:DUF4815 domain-containing protein [Pseudoalteromonas peptidolytica]|uniref:DUF4815 domain-containing protein n=1 Tax=Pseudoalteromonas peptidolytica F12-50-A1 TaxID=1315280 RepID=A0A8I0T4V9_9GAMM|nr:DUF4815 domain-containing protein [Pseudoalteromonas peptidolytica]MBE0347836.1 hypothetical protein [Pseudoalteromonas peptidolytica F12-50-A1]NLR15256.1 DUF4815 domain-containing protein [Pseudoalteromonas peptidolytica]GEK10255.1 hypothetical protein PPE03_25040 [Pseudoalteromonas peptidolytica]
MAVIGVITNEGLSKTINAANQQGWNINPTHFAISATKGDLNSSRDGESTNETWYEAPITSRRVISENSIEFVCNIPPNATTEDMDIGEVYLYGSVSEDDNIPAEEPFLLALGQPSNALTYYFEGSISLRLVVTLTNINISELFEFKYENTLDIDDHNMDADAHPKLISAIAQWVKGLGNALLRNGQLLSGGSLHVSQPIGDDIKLRADAAAIYINGAVLYVPQTAEPISASHNATFKFGVWVDNSGAENVGGSELTSPDASVKWGLDYAQDNVGDFYPVYTVSNGKLLEEEALLSDEAKELVAQIVRYDVDAHGDYAVNGLDVRLHEFNTDVDGDLTDPLKDSTTFVISSGRAHVGGREIDLRHDKRSRFKNNAVTYLTQGERIAFHPNNDPDKNTNRLDLDFGPVYQIEVVYGEVSLRNKKIIRTTEGIDQLGVSAVTSIEKIYIGSGESEVIFEEGTHWDFLGNQESNSTIKWRSVDGVPGPQDSYYVDLNHNEEITHAVSISGDRKAIEIQKSFTTDETPDGLETSLVPGTEVQIDYQWRVPRIDRLYLNKDGELIMKRGVSSPFAKPASPALPDNVLSLAEIYHTWWEEPDVKRDGVKVVHMSDLNKMQQSIVDLYDLVSLERLKNDTSRQAPSATHGLFVDPMLDDDMRDRGLESNLTSNKVDGIEQIAQINPAREELVLPINMKPNSLNTSKETKPWTLDYQHTVLIDKGRPVEQVEKTGSMKVNPYSAFKPIPAKMTLIPAVDIWTESKIELKDGPPLNSTVVNHGVYGFKFRGNVTSQKVGSTSRAAEFLRELDVEFTLEGMLEGEGIQALTFDGDVLPVVSIDGSTPTIADASGVLKGKFKIPKETYPAGRKAVTVKGTGIGGSEPTEAEASFTGKGTITTEEWQTKFSGGFQRWDPLAQTFTLNESHFISGVDIKITKRGAKQLVLQLRNTTVGIPDKTLAEVRVNADELIEYDSGLYASKEDPLIDGKPQSYSKPEDYGWTRLTFDPTYIEAGQEYAFVVLTDDADHEMAIAELGGVNEKQKVITEQAYQIGVMLSSSNATTWTPHQKADLTFRLLRAEFTSLEKEINFGEFEVEKLSDLMVAGGAIRPSDKSNIKINFTTEENVTYELDENVPFRLPNSFTGKVNVSARLSSDSHYRSPLMWPEALMMIGSQASKALYCTRTFMTGAAESTLRVTFEGQFKGDASVQVFYAVDPSASNITWIEMTSPDEKALGIDRTEYTYTKENFEHTSTQIKLVLNGSALNRPVVSNLRAMAF